MKLSENKKYLLIKDLPVLHDEERTERHAIDGHVQTTAIVTDWYWKTTIVGPNQLDQLVLTTLKFQLIAFARVRTLGSNTLYVK